MYNIINMVFVMAVNEKAPLFVSVSIILIKNLSKTRPQTTTKD